MESSASVRLQPLIAVVTSIITLTSRYISTAPPPPTSPRPLPSSSSQSQAYEYVFFEKRWETDIKGVTAIIFDHVLIL